jgi:hypothetical protein
LLSFAALKMGQMPLDSESGNGYGKRHGNLRNGAMTYAVMQTGLEPPSTEQLKNGFQHVPGLTAMDATILGKDALGVLVKGFELERAAAMQSALAAQGVETEVVEEAALTELPPPKGLTKVEFTPEALRIEDVLGRSFPLEWNNILLIAAGRARFTEFKTELVEKLHLARAARHRYGYGPTVVAESETREEQKDHWLLEIITRQAALRYRLLADRLESLLLFQCLGERRKKDPAGNLSLFVRDLAQFAPEALLNHGAFYMVEDSNPSFSYPSQTAFYREITWLLWMVSTGRVQT